MTVAARRTSHPRRALWAGLCGLALILAAVVAWIVVVMTHMGGYPHWSDDSVVPVDGRAHRVEVDGDRPLMIWTFDRTPTCTARDASGAEVPTEAPDGTYRRDGGAADWVGFTVLRPSSDSVEVTCRGIHPSSRSLVMVESVPRLPARMAGDGPEVWVAVGLTGAGLATLVTAALLAVRRHERRLDAPLAPTRANLGADSARGTKG
ncbi:hypothetical protein GHK92_08130 [Nocardioides sp. dk4132]|uniref:hypothetical protein n=1 Tax=unclassified Nocardioides TaxID=2615069 RepID=UPI00129755A3|nr:MULTISPECIES: hypothetical protein [unclassified Nocardioides]MQW75839.1 hypothetical protein [Nocardioides sp. dk4132]QGA08709.1 hypothetical protein GFH29_15890 [Nocardioides sp. dk884]